MNKETKKSRLLIILGIVSIIICISILIKFNLNSKKSFIVVGDESWVYVDDTWSNIKNTSEVFDKYDFNVYVNKKLEGKYEMKYFNNKWYYFDEENDSHKFDNNVISTAGYENIYPIEFDIEEIKESDLININNALKDKNISIEDLSYYPVKQKINYDLDNDGILETIYNINNIQNDYNDDKVITTVIYNKEDKNEIMIYDVSNEAYQDDLYIYNIEHIINFKNKYNLILSKGKNLDITSSSYLMYSFNNNFELVKDYSKNYITIDVNTNDDTGTTVLIIIIAIILIAGLIYFFIKNKTKANNKL